MARDWTQEYFGIKESTPVSDVETSLKKKLEIAIKALLMYKNLKYDGTVTGYESIAKEALTEIEEIK